MTTEYVCPHCGTILPITINVSGENAPKQGDVGACSKCAGLLIFSDDTHMVALSNEALTLLMARDPVAFDRLQCVARVIKEMHKT